MPRSTRTQIRQAFNKFKRRDSEYVRETQNLSESDVQAIIAQYLQDNPVGGSVGFKTESVSGVLSTPFGSSVIFDIAGQVDKKIRLTALGFQGSTSQSGYTLTAESRTIFSNKTILGTTTPLGDSLNGVLVGMAGGSSDAPNTTGYIETGLGEGLKLVKDSGASSAIIYYSYEILVKDE